MKKVLLASTLLLAVAGASVVASAEETKTYNSKGAIEFTPSTSPTDPEDPNIPGEPVTPNPKPDPEHPELKPEPGTNGPLSIDFASQFLFGKQEITSSDKVYNSKVQSYVKYVQDKDGKWNPIEKPTEEDYTEGPAYVQVTDNRGTEAGWVLKIKQKNQFKTAAGQDLKGAQILISNGQVVSSSKSELPSNVPAFTLAVDTEGGSAESIVMSAKAGQGAGTYLNNFGTWKAPKEDPKNFSGNASESVRLSVPGSTTKYAAFYTSDFEWTVSDIVDAN